MRDRLVTWFFLGAFGGLVPLLAEWVVRFAGNKPRDPAAIIGRGELLLVSVVIGSSAVGALVASAAGRRTRAAGWGFGFPTLLLIGVYYGAIAASPGNTSRHVIAIQSAIVFVMVVGLGALCIGLATETE